MAFQNEPGHSNQIPVIERTLFFSYERRADGPVVGDQFNAPVRRAAGSDQNTVTMSKARTGDADKTLPNDQIHQLLSARRRRYVLYYLYRYENPVRLPDIAAQIVKWEPQEGDLVDERSQTHLALYHNHIPKLADEGIVEYDQEEEMVELGENATHLRPYLEHTAETDLDMTDTRGL